MYYNQPLLSVMGQSLGQDARHIGFVAVATQVGYAAGLLFFVPLGDVAERRRLMLRMYAGVTVALVLAAFATSLVWLIVASVLIGLMASVTHVALPIAPDLVPHEQRGRAIGTVMTGLLLGILLARTFAGWLSRLNGWRTVFLVAAVMNAVFLPFIYRVMPKMRPRESLTYAETMRSLWTLFRAEPLLREAGVLGGLVFASFSCFWTTLAFLLQSHYGMGPAVAGTFGVVGAAGALAAPLAGRMSDKRGTRYVVTTAGAVLSGSYIWLWFSERAHASVAMHMLGLVVGVVILDVGAQMMQVANQTRIFGLGAQARSRLNTIYMTMYFAGGALGSALATLAWARWQWDGVCVLELMFIAAAGARHITGYSKRHPQPAVHMPASEGEPA
jgi:predicted MFS family arabinose efflux permease